MRPAALLLPFLLSGCWTSVTPPDGPDYTPGGDWVVTAERARTLLAAGATLLDTREREDFDRGHVPGSRHADWTRFALADGSSRGLLLDDDTLLTERLRDLGVAQDRHVLVAGDPVDGWGEDGRIVWMLRTLGHEQAALVDGGVTALIDVGALAATVVPGDLVVRRTDRYGIDKAQLQELVLGGTALLVDARSRAEYDGETPYGESRGGHLPGAEHLHYRDLLNTLGKLRDRQHLLARLADLGASSLQRQVVVYCTGGVRSAWFVVVLSDLGFTEVRNYAGSMWEWAAGPPDEYPLETD